MTLWGEGQTPSSTLRRDPERLPRERRLDSGSIDRVSQVRRGDRHFDSLLSDSVTRLVMLSDAVSKANLRGIMTKARARSTVLSLGAIERRLARQAWPPRQTTAGSGRKPLDCVAVERGENEGMALRPAWSCACGALRRRATHAVRIAAEARLTCGHDSLIEEDIPNVYTE